MQLLERSLLNQTPMMACAILCLSEGRRSKAVEVLQPVERATAHHSAVLDLKHGPEVILYCIAMLTPRERQVFELIVRGKSNKAVAQVLCSTSRAIKAHRLRMMEKMQVNTVAELLSLAERVRVAMQSADLRMPVS